MLKKLIKALFGPHERLPWIGNAYTPANALKAAQYYRLKKGRRLFEEFQQHAEQMIISAINNGEMMARTDFTPCEDAVNAAFNKLSKRGWRVIMLRREVNSGVEWGLRIEFR